MGPGKPELSRQATREKLPEGGHLTAISLGSAMSRSNSSLSSNSGGTSTPPPKTPSRIGRPAGRSAASTRAGVDKTPKATPARTSIRDQIKALRAQQATPQAKPSPAGRSAELNELIRRAAEHGRLTIPTTVEPALQHLPPALYTLLLGIPRDELSRKAPRESSRAPSGLVGSLASLSILDGGVDPFGGKGPTDEEDLAGPFLGSVDLEVLKCNSQELQELDLELGLFGGLKLLDLRHNQLAKIPPTFQNLTLLTSLNLSHNRFEAFPSQLTLLPCLVDLDLSGNLIPSLDFTMPPDAPIFPSSPPSAFASPPPRTRVESALPSLRTLAMAGNKLTIDTLPVNGWPANIEVLRLSENPLVSRRAGNDTLSLAKLAALSQLRVLALDATGIRSISVPERSKLSKLEVLSLKGNQWLSREAIEDGWGEREVQLLGSETGEETSVRLDIILDPHLLPKTPAKAKRHVFVPSPSPPAPSPPATATSNGQRNPLSDWNDDPFFAPPPPRTSRSAAVAASSSSGKPAPKSTGFLADEFDAPAPSAAELRFARATAARDVASSSSSTAGPSTNGQSEDPYSALHSSPGVYHVALTSKAPNAYPAFPTGNFSLPRLLALDFAPSLRVLSFTGRSLKSFDLPSFSSDTSPRFDAAKSLSITGTPISLSALIPLIPTLFPALESLDLSETTLGDTLLSNAAVVRALVGRLKSLLVREAGVRSLAGLVEVAKERQADPCKPWALQELNIADNVVDQLDPILGTLPLKTFSVERNLFRSPAARVWEKGGTEGLLLWLRESM